MRPLEVDRVGSRSTSPPYEGRRGEAPATPAFSDCTFRFQCGTQRIWQLAQSQDSDGYRAVRKQTGWIKSQVFGRSFSLSRRIDDEGNPEYSLAVRGPHSNRNTVKECGKNV